LETACSASTGPFGDPVPNLTDQTGTIQYTDSEGRLICDPNGRDRRQQMTDAMDDIFNTDPYILVD
jgi:hypothetical protein